MIFTRDCVFAKVAASSLLHSSMSPRIPTIQIKTPADFQKETGVDADALAKLDVYARLLTEWNVNINLVATSTLPEIWQRHFLDSAQLFPLLPKDGASSIADMGSGAGFPGLVLALMGVPNISLIERNTRKSAFLRTVAAETGAKIRVLNLPVEDVTEQFDILISRALADVAALLKMSAPVRKASTVCLFLKGKNLDQELREAQKDWVMDARNLPSCTDAEGTIARLSSIQVKARHVGS